MASELHRWIGPFGQGSSVAMATTHMIDGYRVSEHVLGAVRDASRRTGTDFQYMLAKAAQESGFRPNAEAATSSATGLYQFIERTWLRMVRDYGASHGLAGQARQIDTAADGKPVVANAAIRQRILDLRHDPRLNAVMAGELANENRAHLERTVGGEIGPTELYLAHFLGAEDAARFLDALRATPNRSAAELFPAAARANSSLFFDQATGMPRSLATVRDRLAGRFGGADALSVQSANPTPADRFGPVRPSGYATPALAPSGATSRHETLSLWTLLYLNALPPPGR